MSTTATTIASLPKARTENTGITPELAQKMYDQLGSHHIAVVEFKVATRTEGDDDSHEIKLEIRAVEPVDDDERVDEHLRELQRALYFKRNPQPALTTGDPSEPTVTAVLNSTGELVLNCAECEHRYADTNIAHTRGTSDDYPPCIWRECGHVVRESEDDVCPKTHPGELDLAS